MTTKKIKYLNKTVARCQTVNRIQTAGDEQTVTIINLSDKCTFNSDLFRSASLHARRLRNESDVRTPRPAGVDMHTHCP